MRKDAMSVGPKRANKQTQLWCVTAMSIFAVLAVAFANQADRFGKPTMSGAAMTCGILAAACLLVLLALRTSLWLDD